MAPLDDDDTEPGDAPEDCDGDEHETLLPLAPVKLDD